MLMVIKLNKSWTYLNSKVSLNPILCNMLLYQQRCGIHQKRGPLHDIRVLDLSRVLAGPYCTMVLGDMGAEIIKVERPGVGDETREFGPPFIGTESCYFLSVNRNKKSVCIDMKQKEGISLIVELAKQSDVLVENFLPGKLKSMGCGFQDLAQINPGLIYCSITGHGKVGPYVNKPGYDLVASAIGGMLQITGPKDGPPSRPGIAVTDILTGMYANSAICTALYERKQTGKGKKIDVSLLQTQVAILSDIASAFLNANVNSSRYGTGHPFIVPYQSFRTKDRDIVIAAGNDKQFFNLCKALQFDHLINDKKFKHNSDRVEHRNLLVTKLQNRLIEKPSQYWLERLQQLSVPCSYIHNIKEAMESPQVHAMGMVQELQHPSIGKIRIPGPAVEYNGESSSSVLPPPLLGQHTLEVMKDILNINDNKLHDLLNMKTIAQYHSGNVMKNT